MQSDANDHHQTKLKRMEMAVDVNTEQRACYQWRDDGVKNGARIICNIPGFFMGVFVIATQFC